VWAIDALRGLALFGVLAVNLDTEFRRTFLEQFLDPPPMPAIDHAAALLLSYLLESKAISLFSLLFGVGLAIQHERFAARGLGTARLVRRLLVLLGFGLVHLFLIWNGDILTEYALAGLVLVPFLLVAPAFSLAAALVLFLVFAALPLLDIGAVVPPPGQIEAHIALAREVYGSDSVGDTLRLRIAEVPLIAHFLAYVFPRTLALMLLGSWLWRTGRVAGALTRPAEATTAGVLLLASGLALTAQLRGDIVILPPNAIGGLVENAAAPLLIAFGYAALVLGAAGSRWARIAVGWAVPVGRMAFSNYLAQSLILSLLFYGFGLGLMGRIGPAAGLAIAAAIFTAQAATSAWWLRRYRYGPLEWLWRSLTYGTRQPWRFI
jgi:uncharacterized protein